jgi:hypothetical protein
VNNFIGRFILATISPFILIACSENNNNENPDFNINSLFTDYGTYGRTIYFDDNQGVSWCYYDILTITNSSELSLTISNPMQQECHIDESLYLTTEYINITGEKKINSTEFNIYTTPARTAASYIVYPSNGDFSESNTEYQTIKDIYYNPDPLFPFISLTGFNSVFGQKTIATLKISQINNQYWANRLSAHDHIVVNEFLKNDKSIEEAEAEFQFVIHELYLAFGGPLYDKPLPDVDIAYSLVGRPDNREELYTAHPYQRLTPTEDDPYPLIQVRIE